MERLYTQVSFGSMDSLSCLLLANKYTNLHTKDITFISNQELLRNSKKKISVSILLSFPRVRHRVINVTDGAHVHYVVVCWKEKGSCYVAEIALLWSVLWFGWHEL